MSIRSSFLTAVLSFAPGLAGCAQEDASAVAAQTPPTRVVAQDGSGDFNGTDQAPIQAALDAVAELGGGVVELRAGVYLVRQQIKVPGRITLRGTEDTVLRLPSPVLITEETPPGESLVRVSDTTELAAGTSVQILPPDGTELFSDGTTPFIRFAEIEAVEGDRIRFLGSASFELPAGSRIGYPYKMLYLASVSDVTIEGLTFDGGLVENIPMPGHHQRTAVWVSSLFSYEEGPLAEPAARVRIRHCRFLSCYGRGVAMYNVVDSEVVGCRFGEISDEAIDFDHYCFRCRAIGNEISGAVYGITLNDASHCVVEHNRVTGCRTGITIWWLDRIDPEGLNERNTIQHNFIYGTEEYAIDLQPKAVRNTIRYNFFEGKMQVLEAENTVEHNTRL